MGFAFHFASLDYYLSAFNILPHTKKYTIINTAIWRGVHTMKHFKTINKPTLATYKKACKECKTSCQSACKTSCTVSSQNCESK